MPTVTIPDKICPHCNGNKWYVNRNTGQQICYKKILESNKKYHLSTAGKEALKRAKNKQSANLTDYYIVNLLSVHAWNQGYKIDRKAVTQQQIDRYRKTLELGRELKITSYNSNTHEKNTKNKKSTKITRNRRQNV